MALSDNKRYRELETVPGEYIPDIGIDYPEDDPLARLVPVCKVREIKADENYPYLDDSFRFKMMRARSLFDAGFLLLIANKLIYGIKFKGRDVLKRYRKEFKAGVITVSNHCYKWDGAAIVQALHHSLWIPMLTDLFEGKDWRLLVGFGGIPLSDGSFSAQKKFNEAFDTIHARGGWIHIFAEARSWWYYKPLRPWQKGAFTMAYKYNCPVLPINISYRERTGIYRLFGKKELPLLTVTIGEPIFPDTTQPRRIETERLLKEAHAAVCKLGGITKNSWPAVWDEN